MKPIVELFNTKSILQDSVNCWLQYVLAQPIDIDLRILALFILQYVGIVHLAAWTEKIKPLFADFFKSLFNHPVPAIERA